MDTVSTRAHRPKLMRFITWSALFFVTWCLHYSLSLGIQDRGVWTDQFEYLETRDPRGPNLLNAYGHPGTIILEVGILLHWIFGWSYLSILPISVSLITAAATVAIIWFLHRLRVELLAIILATQVLLINKIFFSTTPPTVVAAWLTVLMVVMAWWILRQPRGVFSKTVVCWGVVMGLTAATRIDIAALVAGPCLLLYWHQSGWKKAMRLAGIALIAFILADPYFWFMPWQHLGDLWRKFTLLYNQYAPSRITLAHVLNAAPWAILGLGVTVALWRQRRLSAILPVRLVLTMALVTVMAVVVVSFSEYQAIRYHYPFILLWEFLLPILFVTAWRPPRQSAADFSATMFRRVATVAILFSVTWALWVYFSDLLFTYNLYHPLS